MKIILIIIALLFVPMLSSAQSPDFGNTWNSKTGKKDMCIKFRTEDGTTTESKRCKEIRVTTGYFTEEDDYFLLNAGSGVSDSTSMTSAESAVPLSFARVQKVIANDPAFLAGTLADGIAGQMTTIVILKNLGNLTWVLTPTTTTGFTSINFFRAGDYATLVFMPGNIGWIVFSRGGVTLDSETNVTRIAGPTTYEVFAIDKNVFVDTDEGAVTVNLPVGVDSRKLNIVNTGSSGNNVTVTPDGSELLLGANSNFTLSDQEALDIIFEGTEGWF